MRTLTRLALSIGATALFAGCGTQSALSPTMGFQSAGGPPYAASLHEGYSKLFSFDINDGASPFAGLLNVNGTLYGTTFTGGGGTNCPDTDGCGTVFSVTSSGKETVLYKFLGPPDGAGPGGRLIDVNGTLYGTTPTGGSCNVDSLGCGTVFSVTTAGKEKVLYRFPGHPGGEGPTGALIDVNGTLYGTTNAGGKRRGGGTVFSITAAGKEHILYIFGNKPHDGNQPSPLVDLNGTLYGTMYQGGTGGYGTVFGVTLAGKQHTLYNFAGPPDGALPTGGLIDVNGTLYGTTSSGGGTYGCKSSSSNCGTVYKVTTAGKEDVLHRFAGAPDDGGNPNGELLFVAGTLYGTTTGGGRHGAGTVFSITTNGKERVLYSFARRRDHDGYAPLAGLTDQKNMLYGTSPLGGDYGAGTVFALKP